LLLVSFGLFSVENRLPELKSSTSAAAMDWLPALFETLELIVGGKIHIASQFLL
jgi:hypothetical protein